MANGGSVSAAAGVGGGGGVGIAAGVDAASAGGATGDGGIGGGAGDGLPRPDTSQMIPFRVSHISQVVLINYARCVHMLSRYLIAQDPLDSRGASATWWGIPTSTGRCRNAAQSAAADVFQWTVRYHRQAGRGLYQSQVARWIQGYVSVNAGASFKPLHLSILWCLYDRLEDRQLDKKRKKEWGKDRRKRERKKERERKEEWEKEGSKERGMMERKKVRRKEKEGRKERGMMERKKVRRKEKEGRKERKRWRRILYCKPLHLYARKSKKLCCGTSVLLPNEIAKWCRNSN